MEVFVLKCKKCGVEIKKGTKMMSGNSQYMIWKCEKCGNEQMQCVGLND